MTLHGCVSKETKGIQANSVELNGEVGVQP